jgi:hypothetical protein
MAARPASIHGTWERRNAVMCQQLTLHPNGTFSWHVRPGMPVLGPLFLLIVPEAVKQSREGTWELNGRALTLHGFPGPAELIVEEAGGEAILRHQGQADAAPYRKLRGEEPR